MDYAKKSLEMHEQKKGKIEVNSKVKIKNKDDLSIAYTPGVAEPCKKIAENKEDVYKYTSKQNMVAIVTDGTAVLGLGDIGPEASLPVMEGKAVLFKEFGGVDAFPIALNTKDVDEIVRTVKIISPGFGGINLEDISAPRCFEIEERLKQELDIPIFHDDQHGTAIVVLAGLINASKLAGKEISSMKIVVSGAGAAAIAITKMLLGYGAKDIVLVDSKSIITKDRKENMNKYKEEIALATNKGNVTGGLREAVKNMDVFIGVSAPGVLSKDMIKTMNPKPIIFAMANPIPEILPEEALEAGALIVATGRSDYPNQINNVLAFPGIFKGALSVNAKEINEEMKLAAAEALAGMADTKNNEIIPSPFREGLTAKVAEAVKKAAIQTKAARIQ